MFHHHFLHHCGRRGAHDGLGRGFGRGFGRGHGHHRHGGGRLFDHGDLRWVVLGLLAEKPRYGYDIIKELEERVGGEYSPSPGVVYPTLTLLEEMGLAAIGEQTGNRKLYTLTPEGEAEYQRNKPLIDAIMARIGGARRGPPASVVRALENLTLAVRLKVRGESLTDEQARALADALDQAARAIEDL
jgi:DNA-binding PadR family transcriptional regulator